MVAISDIEVKNSEPPTEKEPFQLDIMLNFKEKR